MKNNLKLITGIFAFLFLVLSLNLVASASVDASLEYDSAYSGTINYGQSTFVDIDILHYPNALKEVRLSIVGQSNYLYKWTSFGSGMVTSYSDVEIKEAHYSKPGTYTLRLTIETTDGQSITKDLTLIVNSQTPVDTTAPVISITGSNPTVIIQGTAYVDAGATATDNVDGTVLAYTISNNVNVNVPGTYSVVYSAADSSGNSATATRTVIVQSASGDTTSPLITILGNNPETIEVGSIYVDAGATALDDYDGDLTLNITTTSDVDTTTIGVYSIVYTVSDAAGNTANTTRVVNVVADTTAPTINVITPENGEDYDTDGITFEVQLSEAGSVTYSLDGKANVSMTETGSLIFTSKELDLDEDDYSVTFYATDLAGNTAQVTVDFEIDEDAGKSSSSSSSYDGSSYEFKLYEGQNTPNKKIIDLSDSTVKSLNWIQKLINWLVQLFGGEPVY